MSIEDKFGETGGRYHYRFVRVIGLEYIFKVLCLIAEIMIYRLPVRDSLDKIHVDDFRDKLKELEE